MELHYKLSHLPLPAMIMLPKNKRIKKKFAKLKHWLPICTSCIFGPDHCKPWHSKGSKGSIRKESNNTLGKCVSMDQLVLAQPELIPQIAFFLTNLRSWGATAFIDHFSDYVYVALMQDLGLDKTLLAKSSFEQHANEGGISINSYCADNGPLQMLVFRKPLKKQIRPLSSVQLGHIIKMGLSSDGSKN